MKESSFPSSGFVVCCGEIYDKLEDWDGVVKLRVYGVYSFTGTSNYEIFLRTLQNNNKLPELFPVYRFPTLVQVSLECPKSGLSINVPCDVGVISHKPEGRVALCVVHPPTQDPVYSLFYRQTHFTGQEEISDMDLKTSFSFSIQLAALFHNSHEQIPKHAVTDGECRLSFPNIVSSTGSLFYSENLEADEYLEECHVSQWIESEKIYRQSLDEIEKWLDNKDELTDERAAVGVFNDMQVIFANLLSTTYLGCQRRMIDDFIEDHPYKVVTSAHTNLCSFSPSSFAYRIDPCCNVLLRMQECCSIRPRYVVVDYSVRQDMVEKECIHSTCVGGLLDDYATVLRERSGTGAGIRPCGTLSQELDLSIPSISLRYPPQECFEEVFGIHCIVDEDCSVGYCAQNQARCVKPCKSDVDCETWCETETLLCHQHPIAGVEGMDVFGKCIQNRSPGLYFPFFKKALGLKADTPFSQFTSKLAEDMFNYTCEEERFKTESECLGAIGCNWAKCSPGLSNTSCTPQNCLMPHIGTHYCEKCTEVLGRRICRDVTEISGCFSRSGDCEEIGGQYSPLHEQCMLSSFVSKPACLDPEFCFDNDCTPYCYVTGVNEIGCSNYSGFTWTTRMVGNTTYFQCLNGVVSIRDCNGTEFKWFEGRKWTDGKYTSEGECNSECIGDNSKSSQEQCQLSFSCSVPCKDGKCDVPEECLAEGKCDDFTGCTYPFSGMECLEGQIWNILGCLVPQDNKTICEE